MSKFKFTLPLAALLALASASVAYAQQITINNPISGTLCSLLTGLFNAAMIIGAPIAVLFVIWAGTKYVFALGKPDEIRAANRNLKWTLVGIAIFFGALVITNVIFKTVSAFLTNNGQNAINCTLG